MDANAPKAPPNPIGIISVYTGIRNLFDVEPLYRN